MLEPDAATGAEQPAVKLPQLGLAPVDVAAAAGLARHPVRLELRQDPLQVAARQGGLVALHHLRQAQVAPLGQQRVAHLVCPQQRPQAVIDAHGREGAIGEIARQRHGQRHRLRRPTRLARLQVQQALVDGVLVVPGERHGFHARLAVRQPLVAERDELVQRRDVAHAPEARVVDQWLALEQRQQAGPVTRDQQRQVAVQRVSARRGGRAAFVRHQSSTVRTLWRRRLRSPWRRLASRRCSRAAAGA
jgi:hypothetical protein